jgi:hypothetical protein
VKNHAAFSAEVFFQHAPDLVVPKAVPFLPGSETRLRATAVDRALNDPFDRVALRGTLDTRQFRERYLGVVLVPASPDATLGIQTWLRRDRVGDVEAANVRVIPFAGQAL